MGHQEFEHLLRDYRRKNQLEKQPFGFIAETFAFLYSIG